MTIGKISVLVVDDDKDIRDFVRAVLLNGIECEICEAVDGEDALKQCREKAPDLVLLDLVMPNMNGFEVASRLKVMGIPFVALTSMVDVSVIQKLLALGSFSFLAKPVSQGQLLGTVLSAMSHIKHIAAVQQYATDNDDICTAKGAISAYLSIHPDRAFEVMNEMARDQQGNAKDTAKVVTQFLDFLGGAQEKHEKQKLRRQQRKSSGR
jgi:CheY-like chemotaxis protein